MVKRRGEEGMGVRKCVLLKYCYWSFVDSLVSCENVDMDSNVAGSREFVRLVYILCTLVGW